MRGEKVMIELATLFMLGATRVLGQHTGSTSTLHGSSDLLVRGVRDLHVPAVKGQRGSLDVINGWLV